MLGVHAKVLASGPDARAVLGLFLKFLLGPGAHVF